MAKKLAESPRLPVPSSSHPSSLQTHAVSMVSELVRLLGDAAFVINRQILALDGTTTMTKPLPLVSYTVANLPAASDWEAATVYVSDETGGAVLAFSDGSDWRRVTDRAVVSA